MTRGAKACMIVTAALPWYIMLSGSFLLYVFVLMATARLGQAVFAASWLGIIPLALLLLFVNPALLIAALAGNCNLPKLLLGAALLGTAITLTFSAAYAGLSGWIAANAIGVVVGRTDADPVFGALSGLNTVALAAGTWCARVSAKTLWRRLPSPRVTNGRPERPEQ